jgi:AraC-like DNA-binding protein
MAYSAIGYSQVPLMTEVPQRPTGSTRQGPTSTIRAFIFWPLIKELDSDGLKSSKLLRSLGISEFDLQSPYTALPLEQFVALAESVAGILKRPYLGLEMGEQFTFANLGPFYTLFTLATDLKAALATLTRYHKVLQTRTNYEIVRGPQASICSYSIADPSIWPRRQDAEFELASVCMLIRHLTNDHWAPVRVDFEHSLRNRAQRLKLFFRAPVGGNASANSLTILNEDMDRLLRWGLGPRDATLLPVLERHLMDLVRAETVVSQTVSDRTSMHIARTLGHAALSLETTAARFGMSSRTLRRRLSDEKTSFRKLLQMQRRSKIEAILSDGQVPLTTLAGRVSYSDGAVLSRAFKRWTGASPAEYLRAHSI